jgi:tetratricopeptide (TPR) repeat protein
MIVKDEERVLPRCLRSVQRLADEIVVVDTGSSDRTAEIAKSFGAKVLHYQWKDDFAAARNYAMDQATGDWILQIDADEEFHQPDIPHLRSIIRRQDADGIHVVIRNFFPSPATQTDESLPNPMSCPHSVNHFPRLVRNRPEIRYSGAIHEGFRELNTVLVSDISIFHYGYAQEDDRRNRRFERNRRMTLKNVQEHPKDAIAHYYAATTCLSAQLTQDAERHFLEMVRLADPADPRQKHFYQMANGHLATLAMLRNDHEAEERFAREALKPDADYLDPWLRLGEACFFQNKYLEAEQAFRRYLAILKQLSQSVRVTKYTLYLTDEAYYAYFFLGRLAELREDPAAAQTCYERSIAVRNNVWGPHYFLGLLYAKQGDPRSKEHLNRAMELNPELRGIGDRGQGTRDEGQATRDKGQGTRDQRPGTGDQRPEIRKERMEDEAELQSATSRLKSEIFNLESEIPNSQELQQKAHALARQNRLEEASRKLSDALQLDPNSSGLHSDLGWVLFQLGQPDAAERLWLKALDLDARNLAARRNLADYYFETRQLDAARPHYETLLQTSGDQADPDVLDGLADVYAEQGRFAEAIGLYEHVLRLVPSCDIVRAKLIRARQKQTEVPL